MKKEIPIYKHNISLEEVFADLSKENQTNINSFLDKCRTTASSNSIIKIRGKIIPIADIFEKNIGKLTQKDIQQFAILIKESDLALSTKNDYKKVLKRFLKWKHLDWSNKFNNLEDLKAKTKGSGRKLSKKDLLTPEEMKFLVDSSHSLKLKCLLVLMQETAFRPEEVLKLKWKDVDLESNEIKLHSAKTGDTRTIPLKESFDWLRKYKREGFYPRAEAEMWIFPQDTNREKKLTSQLLDAKLKKLQKNLKFKKRLYAYLWRHTILSHMIRVLSPKCYEKFSGHSLQTGLRTYAHLNTDDLRQELDEKHYQVQDLAPSEREEFEQLKKEVQQNRLDIAKLTKLSKLLEKIRGEL